MSEKIIINGKTFRIEPAIPFNKRAQYYISGVMVGKAEYYQKLLAEKLTESQQIVPHEKK
jgi:hypothetical protein